jgi:hypothetical protein
MTGRELLSELNRLPNDVLEQPVIRNQYNTDDNGHINNDAGTSIIISEIISFSSALDIDGNFILLS